jgi:hypothetical protein
LKHFKGTVQLFPPRCALFGQKLGLA